MESIEKHIEEDKKILENPTTSPQQRRHIEGELHDLEDWVAHHKEEIEAGDHHDPSPHLNFIVTRNLVHLNVKFTTTDVTVR